MPRDIISQDYPPETNSLSDRLDASIGETSSGIGVMMSELLRRSLKAGVSDIGESLGDFAEEQVETAVEQKMPEIAEAAHSVAESTARKVVSEREGALQDRIQEAEVSAKAHVTQVVGDVRESLDETRTMAMQRSDASEKQIDELRDKARATWHKLKQEFSTLDSVNKKLRAEQKRLQKQLTEAEERLERQEQQWRATHELLSERLSLLEQPRGIKKLWAKFTTPKAPAQSGPDKSGPDKSGPDKSGPDKSGPDQSSPDARGPDSTGDSGDPAS